MAGDKGGCYCADCFIQIAKKKSIKIKHGDIMPTEGGEY